MSNDSSDRLSELLSSAREEFETDASLEDALDRTEELAERDELNESDDLSPLLEHATDAREVIETNDPKTVLEAAGLSRLPDGSEPSSIPEAIAKAPEEQLHELHALVTLANIAALLEDGRDDVETGDDTKAKLEDALSDLQQTLETSQEETQAGSESSTEPADSSSDESSEEEESTLESALQSVAGTGVEGFSDELESLQDRLEGLREDEADGSVDEDDSEQEGDEVQEADDREESNQDDEEDGLLGGDDDDGLVGGGDDDSSTGRSTTHSTMPSSKRADMNAVARPSTMPDRN